MHIRQFFDAESSTYTYLVADNGEATLIDPVLEKIEDYKQILHDLELSLKFTLDTHTHADHVTAQGKLRDDLGSGSLVGAESLASCASAKFKDGDMLKIGNIEITAMYTPGHTDDSYCFVINGKEKAYVFTGDTLLIRGTGRTDFQNGDAKQQFSSLKRLLELPDETIVYPGHDYKGWTQSTIGEEEQFNPRLQFNAPEDFADFMATLDLPNPKLMDVAVPLNQTCGKA